MSTLDFSAERMPKDVIIIRWKTPDNRCELTAGLKAEWLWPFYAIGNKLTVGSSAQYWPFTSAEGAREAFHALLTAYLSEVPA